MAWTIFLSVSQEYTTERGNHVSQESGEESGVLLVATWVDILNCTLFYSKFFLSFSPNSKICFILCWCFFGKYNKTLRNIIYLMFYASFFYQK